MSGTHRAVVCERISKSAREGIEATVLKELPNAAQLAPAAVRVSVRSASINFPELLMMQNKYQYKPTLPFVLCTEGAGVVSEVGAKVTRFRPGDRVFFSTFGCATEEIVLMEKLVHPLPAGMSFSQGAGFLMGYETGFHGLVHRGQLKAGEWLLVTGAGGGMGVAAVQLGKALGARVIAAASSDDKLRVCRELGAEAVINYSGAGLKGMKDEVKRITKGKFCDVIYDPVGGDVFDQCVRCVSPQGYARLLVVGFASGRIPSLPANMALIKGFSLVGVRMGAQMQLQPKLKAEMHAELLKLAQAGKLRPYVCAEYPVEQFKDAFRLMEERKVIGKCCITFPEKSPAKL
eukprot:TRINITY_DN21828_c0_g1_i1.p1 TRINITY_DN21828_c0_g1~~TRINITY_DN21828_c0_g1_i1.p1  ORF type:complete len:347 (+),score=144.86 TRINITY_DN21828_c0_g1_i1:77-1117(+)